jgi:hypothetical protein
MTFSNESFRSSDTGFLMRSLSTLASYMEIRELPRWVEAQGDNIQRL